MRNESVFKGLNLNHDSTKIINVQRDTHKNNGENCQRTFTDGLIRPLNVPYLKNFV